MANKKWSVTLSASKIKTAQGCSFKYWASYHLHLPDRGNDGSKRGNCIHVILECLAVDRRRNLVERLIKERSVLIFPSLEKLATKLLKQAEIFSPENLILVCDSIVHGVTHDFYGERRGIPIATYTEKDFLIETDKYKIRGFIDRLFIYEDGSALIRDYKSSKECYKGEDATNSNIQGTCYTLAVQDLAAKGLIPPVKSISVEFLFLKFDCNQESSWATGIYQGKVTKKLYHNGGGCITLNYEWNEAKGFEYYLASVQNYLENFAEEDAVKNLAANMGRPTDDTFSCNMLCGFDSRKGELKNDGTPKFSCAQKWAFNYLYISKDNQWVASCYMDEREKYLKKYPINQYLWEEKSHKGCPAHKNRG